MRAIKFLSYLGNLGHLRKLRQISLERLVWEFKILGPVLVLILTFYNLTVPKTEFEKAKEKVMINSNDIFAREILARKLLENNQLDEAEKVITGIRDKGLGVSRIEEQITAATNEPEKVKEEIRFWEKVTEELPNYRDAYVRLAVLNWKIYRNFEAQKWLAKAVEVDPNNGELERLFKELK